MQIERDPNGDFILQPADLAERFGLTSDDFRRKMQKGLLASTVEVGEGEDAGTCRLSLRLGNRLWRAILDSEDRVMSEEMTFVRGQLLRRP
ncbi:hypothetical protein HFC70_07055 [Agrobacterium sp. a22-2]|uniref:DUF6522 family protein n=1 Tax=Agrobacterium sp. a22-2 TaxID=2283840 RepID=UPI00144839DC|nr:DUF6522 family protein [Agrobacterium sp. a22-2]NKN36114.1 hypothetical protein [Agrobacterium sp. a22-2]